ncbi:MAG TPA: ABC transporter permease [Abditibacteriaceae bacterium]|jgi:ABC-type transport system involved in multi-copper enzyme maturation permease subunit
MLFHNPVFNRESRVRWRSWRPFGLLFGYAMALAYVLGWSYATAGAGNVADGNSGDLAAIGREMFRSLQMLQMTAWLLLVPILTATIVSSERERGLLEALQLSGLRARQIIGGKLGAVLLFVLLLLLAGTPVTSICFLLGGVAPEEFLKSLLLQATTILLCATLGLFFSARARRSLIAVRNAFGAMLLLAVATAFASYLNYEIGLRLFGKVAAFITLLNPLRAQMGVFDDFASTYPELGRFTSSQEPFVVTLNGMMICSLLFLWGAGRGVRRVFDDAQWMERKKYLTWRNGRLRWRNAEPDAAALARWNNETKPPPVDADINARREAKDIKESALALFDTPLAAFVRFQNPVLQREVRGKLRMRRYPKPVTVVMSSLALIGGVAYLFGILMAWTEHNAHREMWTLFVFGSLFGITLVLPLMGAGALARERDNGTWEMLETSLIEPHRLIAGKVLAPLFFVVALFFLLLPMLLPCVRNVTIDLMTLFVLAAASFCYSAWGVWLSWHFRSPVTAMAVALVSMLVILGFMPWLITFFIDSSRGSNDQLSTLLSFWHPWVAIGSLVRENSDSQIPTLEASLANILFLTTIGFALLADLNRRITKAWRLPRYKRLSLLQRPGEPAKPAKEVA